MGELLLDTLRLIMVRRPPRSALAAEWGQRVTKPSPPQGRESRSVMQPLFLRWGIIPVSFPRLAPKPPPEWNGYWRDKLLCRPEKLFQCAGRTEPAIPLSGRGVRRATSDPHHWWTSDGYFVEGCLCFGADCWEIPRRCH